MWLVGRVLLPQHATGHGLSPGPRQPGCRGAQLQSQHLEGPERVLDDLGMLKNLFGGRGGGGGRRKRERRKRRKEEGRKGGGGNGEEGEEEEMEEEEENSLPIFSAAH